MRCQAIEKRSCQRGCSGSQSPAGRASARAAPAHALHCGRSCHAATAHARTKTPPALTHRTMLAYTQIFSRPHHVVGQRRRNRCAKHATTKRASQNRRPTSLTQAWSARATVPPWPRVQPEFHEAVEQKATASKGHEFAERSGNHQTRSGSLGCWRKEAQASRARGSHF